MYTPAQVIEIAKVSSYLASQDIAFVGMTNGIPLDRSLPDQIQVELGSLIWAYDQYGLYGTGSGITEIQLQGVANYVFGLCKHYALKALEIINGAGNGGGVVVVPGTAEKLDPIYFVVGGSYPYAPANGSSSYINPDLAGVTNFYIISNADGGTLWAGVHFSVRATGGFDFLGGRQFYTNDAYTIIFY